jgi:hypothetical protein
MKLKGLSRQDLAYIGYAVSDTDNSMSFVHIVESVGEKLGIKAVFGEGYDTTVYRCCCMMLGIEEIGCNQDRVPTCKDRIFEALNNIGLDSSQGEEQRVLFRVLDGDSGDTDTAIALLGMMAGDDENSDAHHAIDTIKTIVEQTEEYIAFAAEHP